MQSLKLLKKFTGDQKYVRAIIAIVCLIAVTGCGSKKKNDVNNTVSVEQAAKTIEIVGNYLDEWGGEHVINAKRFIQVAGFGSSAFEILTYSNSKKYIIAKNSDHNDWYASQYSRFDWATVNSQLYFCQTAYTATSAAQAESMTPSDPSNLMGGCGGFPWSKLTAQVSNFSLGVLGTYHDDYSTPHHISGSQWVMDFGTPSTFNFEFHSNAFKVIIAKNSDSNSWSPGLYSRFDLHTDSSNQTWFCQTVYDAGSFDEALTTTAADSSNPASSGCGGFAWSKLIP